MNARQLPDENQHDCPVCGAEEPYVLFDGDKMCEACGHTPTAGGRRGTTDDDEWAEWFDHRASMYSGWYGPDRIKFPGGFAVAYDFSSDF